MRPHPLLLSFSFFHPLNVIFFQSSAISLSLMEHVLKFASWRQNAIKEIEEFLFKWCTSNEMEITTVHLAEISRTLTQGCYRPFFYTDLFNLLLYWVCVYKHTICQELEFCYHSITATLSYPSVIQIPGWSVDARAAWGRQNGSAHRQSHIHLFR